MKGGQARDILLYNKNRVFAFVLALGEVDDLKYAAAAGRHQLRLPGHRRYRHPGNPAHRRHHIRARGVSMPFNEIAGADDLERAEPWCRSASKCAASRSRSPTCPSPCPTARPSKARWCARTTCASNSAASTRAASNTCAWPTWTSVDRRQDRGRRARTSPRCRAGRHMDMGIVVEVAGRKMQKDFEPVLERQIHYFVNGASGIQHIGQRDIAWIRISKNAADKGFDLRTLRRHPACPLPRRVRRHRRQGPGDDLHRSGQAFEKWLAKARAGLRRPQQAPGRHDRRRAWRSSTPAPCANRSRPTTSAWSRPERLGLCGAYNWLDCKASFQINPTGPNQPIKKGIVARPEQGLLEGDQRIRRQRLAPAGAAKWRCTRSWRTP